WSDTTWLAALFLASSVSTGLASLILLTRWKRIGTEAGREKLERADLSAIGLEAMLFAVFLASLGPYLFAGLGTGHGHVLLFGTVLAGMVVPLVLHLRSGRGWRWGAPVAAISVLLGGLFLRYGVVSTPPEILARGPGLPNAFAPEEHRRVGEPGADM